MDDRPKIRYLEAVPVEAEGQKLIYLKDPEGLTDQGFAVSYHVYYLLTLFDGQHSIDDLAAAFNRKFDQSTVNRQQIEELVLKMDELYFLDSERYRQFREDGVAGFRAASLRQAAHAGAAYPNEADALRKMMDGFFLSPEGPGVPEATNGRAPIRGLIAPHIDFNRGGPCFAWAYKALAEAPPPDIFFVFGTGHSARRSFVLSRKDFETPFGILKADQEVIDRLSHHVTEDLFEDEFSHRSEHSIEFQTLFLKYLYPDRDITFVPVLIGSFHEMVVEKCSPLASSSVSNFLEAVRLTIEGLESRVCFIAGVDFSHVGARFGDEEDLSETFIDRVEKSDQELLKAAEAVDAEGFFDAIVREGDRNRVCGTSSIYTMLQSIEAERGVVLKHDRTIDEKGQSLVSFASVAYY